ncbi:transcription initiation factor TFIID subunit 11 [Phytophthora pseudosyringae]|uniref:Transcription initiation factor TFIID subunit 11 n=1 Tax=Phytophthora pseudosyringae TaxID=221518 RepID=A0A8T1WIN6_9STRA|nr:transcription initiation factor TFIID subunit 11 [Phytophthora pseudosyringae]
MDADMPDADAARAAARSPTGLSAGSSIINEHGLHIAAGEASDHAEDVGMALPSASQDTEDEDDRKALVARHGDVTTDDEPQSTADEEENDEEDDELDSDEDKVEPSDSASMLRLMQTLPEAEARRHEQFRRSHFERGAIKRCMTQAILECSATDKKTPSVTNVMAIVMAGMTKVFVGEITAEARRIMEKNGETGPIRPRHLREAHRKYYKRRPLARGRKMRRLFR